VTRTEDQLRELFTTDAERIQHSDLRPAPAFERPRERRTGWMSAVLAATAAAVVILFAPRLFDAAPPPAATSSLTVTFTMVGTNVNPPGVTVSVPEPQVTAADPQAARKVTEVIRQTLAETVIAFRSRSEENISLGEDARFMSERIVVADVVTWSHYLSVRFDSFSQVGGLHPINEVAVLTFDTATGTRILTTDLFTDVTATTSVVRAALLAEYPAATLDGADLAVLSLRPTEEGSTPPLSCYPTPPGLRCLVDQGQITPYAAGRLETLVGWDRLAPLLRPGVN
jgi:hypothetical protein